MLFKISWSVNAPNRVDCWNIFGNMTAADDLKDCGENIKIVGDLAVVGTKKNAK